MIDKLYTRNEVADIFKVDVRTIDRWIKVYAIKPKKIARSVRLTEENINEMVKRGSR
jgi:predicted site-specific integrase-resolvase